MKIRDRFLEQKHSNKHLSSLFQAILILSFLLFLPKETVYAQSWVTSTIDSDGDVGTFTSIAIDLDNNYLIAYLDTTNGDLKFSKYDGTTWSTITVDSTCGFNIFRSAVSITVDNNNNYLIAYYDAVNKDLKFAKYNGTTWSTTTIDSTGDIGQYPSITTTSDINDYYLISYLDHTNGDLKLAKYDGSTWTTSIIDSTGYVGQYSSITTDSNNNYLVSYHDPNNYDLKFAKYNGSTWSIETVDSEGLVGWDTSITTDNNNNYLISYYQSTSISPSTGILKLAKYNGTYWTIEGVTDSFGRYSSIKVDQDNNYIISYAGNYSLNFSKYDGTSWTHSSIDAIGTVGDYTSIAVDQNNKYIVSYHDYTNDDLKFAITGTNITPPQISFTPLFPDPNTDTTPYFGGIAEEDGSPIASIKYQMDSISGTWQDCSANDSMFDELEESFVCLASPPLSYGQHTIYIKGTNADGATTISGDYLTDTFFINPFLYPWITSISTVDSTGEIGKGTSITTDMNNNYLISYYDTQYIEFPDETFYTLKLAKYDGSTWTTNTIELTGIFPSFFFEDDFLTTSIVADINNNYLISYFDYPSGILKLALYDGNDWTITSIDSTDYVGQYSSITIDSDNNYLVSYYDMTNGDLKFAIYDGDSWTLSTIDSTGDVGQYTSITTDEDNNYLISYFDSTNQALKFAKYDGANWTTTTVDSTSNVGKYSSITVDKYNNYLISYYDDHPNYDLKFAKYDGNSWTTSIVDSTEYVGDYSSITTDENNNYLISYHSSGDLKLAKYNGDIWINLTLDSIGDVGKYTSITTDSNNKYLISYYDETNQDLKAAVLTTDRIPPTISLSDLVQNPTSDTTPTFTGLASDTLGAISSVQYQVDTVSGQWNSCNATDGTFGDEYTEDFTCAISLVLNDGSHTIYVKATDSNNNTVPIESYSSKTFTVDSLAPSLSVNEIDGYPYITQTRWLVNRRPVFKGRAEVGATITVSIPTVNISSQIVTNSNGSWTWQPSNNLPIGTHYVFFEATDDAGNKKSVKVTLIEVVNFTSSEQSDTQEEITEQEVIDEQPENQENPPSQENTPDQENTNDDIQVLQFLDKDGNPLVNAYVQINGVEYYTDSKGEIKVVGLEKNKNYKIKIEHNGIKYKSEVLGASETDGNISLTITDEHISDGIDWKKILIYSVAALLFISFLLLIFRKRKEREDSSSNIH